MKKRKTNEKRRTERELTPARELRCGLIGGFFSCAAAILLLPIFAYIALMFSDPSAAGRVIGAAVLYISALAGGICSGKLCSEKTLICGTVSGLLFALVTFVLSFIPIAGVENGNLLLSLCLRLPLIALSYFGAYISSRKSPRRGRRHRASHA